MQRASIYITIVAVLTLTTFFITSHYNTVTAQSGVQVEACAATPNTLGGQGFQVTGLGFQVTGLGFQVTGLGFQVTGLGFQVTGLGIDPERVALDIQNNQITADWFEALLGSEDQEGITTGLGYNTNQAAIVIIDDQEHGSQVLAALDALRNDPEIAPYMSNITVRFLDIGIDPINYEANAMAVAIEDEVNSLLASGIDHIVLNMSFGFIPCEDEETGFDFQDYLTERDAHGEPASVRPVLECVTQLGEGIYLARFGYLNENAETTNIPVGNNNSLTASAQNSLLPTLFETGRKVGVFEIPFNGSELVWTLEGPDGIRRTSTASSASSPCDPPPTEAISPVLECVGFDGEQFIAHFGYNNPNNETVRIPSGADNFFNREAAITGAVYFTPGRSENVFEVPFNGSDLVWTLTSPNGSTLIATANSNSDACIEDLGYSISDYMYEELGLNSEQIDAALDDFTANVEEDADLDTLRALLGGYLDFTAANNNEKSVLTVASSGNYRPWLGATPLIPARWDETIASSATLGNAGPLWQFSHDGNIRTPGAGYNIGNNTVISGTSFAAPGLSLALAQYGTYPAACQVQVGSDGTVYPPLVNQNWTNSILTFGQTSPLTCYINQAPLASDDSYTTDQGSELSVAINEGVLANDSDPDMQPITVTDFTQPQFGTLTVNADGSFTYVHDGSENFADSFTYTISDNGNPVGTSTATVALTIEPDAGEVGLAVTSFTLVNSTTNQPIAGFDPIVPDENGLVVVDVAAIGTDRINLIANTTGDVGSVVFEYGANSDYNRRFDNRAPYAFQGDNNGNFRRWQFDFNVTYLIRATPYTERAGRGEAGELSTLMIQFVDSDAPQIELISDQFDDNGTTIDPLQIVVTNGDGDTGLRYFTINNAPLPPGLSLNRRTGVISGTINAAIEEDKTYPVTIRVRNGERKISLISFNWTVFAEGEGGDDDTVIDNVDVCWVENQNNDGNSVWRVTNNNTVPLQPGTQERVVFDYSVYDSLDGQGNMVQGAQLQQTQTGADIQISTSAAMSIVVSFYIWDNGSERARTTVIANVPADVCDQPEVVETTPEATEEPVPVEATEEPIPVEATPEMTEEPIPVEATPEMTEEPVPAETTPETIEPETTPESEIQTQPDTVEEETVADGVAEATPEATGQ